MRQCAWFCLGNIIGDVLYDKMCKEDIGVTETLPFKY